MGLKQQLERIEEAFAKSLAEEAAAKVNLVLEPDWMVELPASVYPEVMRRVELIYGDHPKGSEEERIAA